MERESCLSEVDSFDLSIDFSRVVFERRNLVSLAFLSMVNSFCRQLAHPCQFTNIRLDSNVRCIELYKFSMRQGRDSAQKARLKS